MLLFTTLDKWEGLTARRTSSPRNDDNDKQMNNRTTDDDAGNWHHILSMQRLPKMGQGWAELLALPTQLQWDKRKRQCLTGFSKSYHGDEKYLPLFISPGWCIKIKFSISRTWFRFQEVWNSEWIELHLSQRYCCLTSITFSSLGWSFESMPQMKIE